MRYHEIITEIISTKLSKSLSYDAKNHRLIIEQTSGLFVDKEAGQLIAFERPTPAFTLRHRNRIKKLRRQYLKQQEKLKKFRHVMYGGAETAIDREQDELSDLKKEIGNLR